MDFTEPQMHKVAPKQQHFTVPQMHRVAPKSWTSQRLRCTGWRLKNCTSGHNESSRHNYSLACNFVQRRLIFKTLSSQVTAVNLHQSPVIPPPVTTLPCVWRRSAMAQYCWATLYVYMCVYKCSSLTGLRMREEHSSSASAASTLPWRRYSVLRLFNVVDTSGL